MNKIKTLPVVLMTVCLSVFSRECLCAAESRRTCQEWQASIRSYDKQAEAIVDGEPEDLMRTLQAIIEADKNGNAEEVARLGRHIKNKVPALSEIQPPRDLAEFHRKLIQYHIAVAEAVEAVERENIGLQSIYTRKCYEALLDYFQELKAVLMEKECDTGDIAALQETIIPEIEKVLSSTLSYEAIEAAEKKEEAAGEPVPLHRR